MITQPPTLERFRAWLPAAHAVGDLSIAFGRVHADSRTLQPGDLFVALQGTSFDGNQFLQQAANAGAVGAICSAKDQLEQSGLPGGLVVEDPLAALQMLAAQWRRQFHVPVIAVTGSNGKTTVTQMIGAVLGQAWGDDCLVTAGNLNNHIGVPLTLLRLRARHKMAVVELGMNHPGEIAQLADWVRPTVALVNNAQREHQEFMASVEAVARENGSVFASLAANGVAVFPVDDEYAPLWRLEARHCLQATFSGRAVADSGAWVVKSRWNGSASEVAVQTSSGVLRFALHMVGEHNVKNSVAAAVCCLAAGVPVEAIEQGLESFKAVAGRSRLEMLTIGGKPVSLVDDSYNANPDSAISAARMLHALPGPRLLILGDMGEVGDQGPQFHRDVGAFAAQIGIDRLLTCGQLSAHAADQFKITRGDEQSARHFETVEDLTSSLGFGLAGMASVLVKGSRFMKMERVVQRLKVLAAEDREAACS